MSLDTNNYINVKTTVQRIGVAEITLRRMIAKGAISHTRVGSGRGRIFFDESHLKDYYQPLSTVVDKITLFLSSLSSLKKLTIQSWWSGFQPA
jgi:hypothetical protein